VRERERERESMKNMEQNQRGKDKGMRGNFNNCGIFSNFDTD
jgi:hypothetical protein